MTKQKIPAGTKVKVKHSLPDRIPETVEYTLGKDTNVDQENQTQLLRLGPNRSILESVMCTYAISQDGLIRENVGVPIVINRPYSKNSSEYESLNKILEVK
jgi:hypothetical protein